MDYRWKDIFVTILPGATFLILVASFLLCEEPDLLSSPEISSLKTIVEWNGPLATLMFPFLCIMIGYSINEVISCIVHCEKIYLSPVKEILDGKAGNDWPLSKNVLADLKKQIKKEEDYKVILHKVKDSLSPNGKIEEYFVHYAQCQNMFGSHLLALIIALIMCISNSECNLYIGIWFVYVVLVGCIFLYKRNCHYKRYVQVIFSEYNKERLKTENN